MNIKRYLLTAAQSLTCVSFKQETTPVTQALACVCNKNYIQKRYISLIELLVAMGLTIAILMTLTFFYRQVTEIEIEIDRTKAQNFNSRYIESRLSLILPKAVAASKKDFLFFSIGDEGLTKPGSKSLLFTFDNNISLDKAFSNNNLARLYLDKNGNLMLAYWPSPLRWENGVTPPMKKELLFQGADNLSFEFYIAPARAKAAPESDQEPEAESQSEPETADKQQDKKKTDEKNSEQQKQKQEAEKKEKLETEQKEKLEPEPKGEWRRLDWLEDYHQLPVMVKVILTLPKVPEPLIFIYPLANTKSHVVYE